MFSYSAFLLQTHNKKRILSV